MVDAQIPFAPMLASVGEPSRMPGPWCVEMKWDGVRTVVDLDEKAVRMWSRRGHALTDAFPEVAEGLRDAVDARSAVLDGEVVILGADNRPDFSLVQRRLGSSHRREPAAVMFVFDILRRNGRDLIDRPYRDRRHTLEELVESSAATVVPPVYSTDVEAALAISLEHGIEGVVAKRPDSRYFPGRRTGHWVKVTHTLTCEAAVIGFARGSTGRLASLVLAVADASGELHYVGRVSSGLSATERHELERALMGRAIGKPAALDTVLNDDVVWTEPRTVVEVALSQWTREGRMRHPRWRGLRLDKSVSDLTPP